MRTFKKFVEENNPDSVDLFSPRDPNEDLEMYRREFAIQDEWAEKSPVFQQILQSEIKDDPKERYISTNSPKSKTRNALICRFAYRRTPEALKLPEQFDQKAWEDDLLTNPFYGLT